MHEVMLLLATLDAADAECDLLVPTKLLVDCCREFHFSSVKIHADGVYAVVCYHDCSVV